MGALRLFLALVVVFSHAQFLSLTPLHLQINAAYTLGFNGGYAVMYFYLISGFLISFVLRHKYPATPEGMRAFYWGRFVRIFSVYWPVLILAFYLIPPVFNEFRAARLADKLTGLFLFGADWNLLFSHYSQMHWEALPQCLHQAWTLGPELTFYLLAPFVLRSPALTWGVFLVSAVTRAVLVAKFGFTERWAYHFFPSTVLFFLMGHLALTASERFPLLKRLEAGLLLLAVSFLALNFPKAANWDSGGFWVSVTCFALALPGIFAGTKDNKVLNFLGELSFPVYLVHVFIIVYVGGVYDGEVVQRYGVSSLSGKIVMGATMAVILVVSALFYLGIEVPLSYLMRRPRFWTKSRGPG